MPTNVGPNTKGEESLVFGYDLGDGNNSYKGAPTINYTAHQNAVKQSSYTPYVQTTSGTWPAKHPRAIRAYNIDGGEITGYVNTGVTDYTNTYHAVWEYDPILDKPVVVMDCTDSNWKAKSMNPNTGQWASQGWTVGTKYVISWLQWTTHLDKSLHVGLYTRNSSNSQNFWDGLSNNSTTSRNTKVKTWQRVYHVYTVTSNWDQTIDYQRIYMYGQHFRNGPGVMIKVADVQLEIGQDYPTPYTGETAGTSGRTTRSATEGLLDLKGNSTIDLTNVSFDSEGKVTFDGTDDRLAVTPRRQYAIADAWTTELVFKPTNGSDTSWNGLFGGSLGYGGYWMFHSSGNLTYYEGSSTETGTKITYRPWTKANTFTTDNYHHLTIVYTPTSATTGNFDIYYNGGEKVDSFGWTFSWSHSLDMQTVGSGDGRYGTNDVHYFKQYNRVLTASEIQANYNAIKGRFNI